MAYLHGIPVTLLDDRPAVIQSSIAGFVHGNVHAHIQAGDTVRVDAFNNSPAIVGRIIDIATTRAEINNDEAIHPFIRDTILSGGESLFKLNIYLINNNSLLPTLESWHHVHLDISRACGVMLEAAPTNGIVWVSSKSIKDVVFLLHANECINEKYGSVVSRTDTHFIRHTALLAASDEGEISFSLHELNEEEYKSFGCNMDIDQGAMCITQRYSNTLHQIYRAQKQLLTKFGMVGGYTSIKFPMDHTCFNWLKKRILELGGDNFIVEHPTRNAKDSILYANLSYRTILAESNKVIIKSINLLAVDTMRSLVSQVFGIGLKKQKVKTALINNADHNPSALQNSDTVHMLDVDLTVHADAEDRDTWLANYVEDRDEYYNTTFRQRLRMEYDIRLSEFRLGVKGVALNAGVCRAERYLAYRANADNTWRSEVVHYLNGSLYTTMSVEFDGDIWIVDTVDLPNDRVVLVLEEDTSVSHVRTTQECIDNAF